MKRVLQLIVIILVIFCAAIFTAYYIFETKIKKQIIPNTTAFIKEQTQLNVSFKKFKFSFTKLLQLEPTIKIEEVNIENSICVNKILIELYLKPLLKKKFEIKQIIIEDLKLSLQENSKHEVSVKGINSKQLAKAIADNQKKSKEKQNADLNLVTDFELNKLLIKNSTVNYYAYNTHKPIKIYPIEVELSDLGYGANDQIVSKLKFNAKLLGSKSSQITGSGTMGPLPLDLSYIPISGNETLTIFINDIPEADRKVLLGELVINDSKTQVIQKSQFAGDLLSSIRGTGTAEIKDLILGKSRAHYITASSTIPLTYTLRLNQNPNLKLESKNAILNLSGTKSMQGKLNFDTYISYDLDTAFMEGSSHGRLSGLEIQEALNCFTDFRNLISGVFEVTDYHIYFQGANAKQINKSLKANGAIEIKDGSLYILQSITKYKDIAALLIKNGDQLTEKIGGQFVSLKTDFNLKDGDLYTDNIALQTTNYLNIAGSGVIRATQALEYDVFINITGLKQIPIKIKGTIKKPKIYPDIKALGQEQSKQLVNTALGLGLGMLKQYAEQNTKTTNGATTNTTPVKINKKQLKDLGNQLLKGIIIEPKTVPTQQPTSNNGHPATTTTTTTTTTSSTKTVPVQIDTQKALKLGQQLLKGIILETNPTTSTTSPQPTTATSNGTGL